MSSPEEIIGSEMLRFEMQTAALPPVRVEADVRQVAAFRLPVSVKSLAAMVDGLTREYGKDLTMRQVGDSLIIEQPNTPLQTAERSGASLDAVVGGSNE
jgi:hypothetical protein